MMKKVRPRDKPPVIFLRFFRWFCHPSLRKHIEGDLMELYNERLNTSGRRSADIKFALDVLLLFRPGIIRSAKASHTLNQYGMFKNYFNVSIRNILKYKVFSFINVFGLSVAMAVCMLIMLMLADQKSYDQFHLKKDRIYRIISDEDNSKAPNAVTAFPLAEALRSDYPVVEETTHLVRGIGGELTYNERTRETGGYFADPAFFSVFSYPLESGDKDHALSLPNTMVMTKEYAHTFFGDEPPLGKTVELTDRGLLNAGDTQGAVRTSWGSFTVTGVLASPPGKTHLKFDVLVSSASRKVLQESGVVGDLTNNWNDEQCYTYVVLDPDKYRGDLTAALHDLVSRKYTGPDVPKGLRLMEQALQDITPGIHVRNEPSSSMPVVAYYFLSLLALLILLSACLNYANLSTARSLTRAKEIGIRKVTGAYRKNLVYQFLSESVITSLLALAMAILLLVFIKPAFRGLWINQHLNFDLRGNISVYLAFIGFALFVGVVAGIYPALRLSRHQPVQALKGSEERKGKMGMRKVLSISQFVISMFFITTSILIYNQVRYFLEFEYGFNAHNIVNIPLQGNDFHKVSEALRAVPGVSAVSGSDIVPATGTENGTSLRISGSEEEYESVGVLLTDENFTDNLSLELVAGKGLPVVTDSASRSVLVNEAAVKAFGFQRPAEMIGQLLESKWDSVNLEVVGVVKDFRFRMLLNEDRIGPLVLRNQPGNFQYANIRIASSDLPRTLSALEKRWKQVDAVHPFKYEFFDDQLDAMYRGIFDLVSILGSIAFLAIVIACLGMLGMATLTAERKKKEVGIRKVLGAEVFGIVLLLSREFLVMLAISVCIGIPMSYFINNLWLQMLPNRVDFGFGTVILGSLILLVLGSITIGSQTLRASRRNPVEVLKME